LNRIFPLAFLFALLAPVLAADDPFVKAEEYFDKGKFEMALLFYNRAIEARPDNVRAYFNRGRIRLYNKDFASAESDFKRVLDIEPKRTEVHYYLGCAQAGAGEGDAAVESFGRVPKKDKNYASVFLNLGNVHLALRKDKDQTIVNWEKFLELRPEDEQAENIRKALICLKDPNCWETVLAALNNASAGTNATGPGSGGPGTGGDAASSTNGLNLPDFFMPDIQGEGSKADVSKQKSSEGKKSIQTE
jgi:tetratricopeptide (TPR) repeat protein